MHFLTHTSRLSDCARSWVSRWAIQLLFSRISYGLLLMVIKPYVDSITFDIISITMILTGFRSNRDDTGNCGLYNLHTWSPIRSEWLRDNASIKVDLFNRMKHTYATYYATDLPRIITFLVYMILGISSKLQVVLNEYCTPFGMK